MPWIYALLRSLAAAVVIVTASGALFARPAAAEPPKAYLIMDAASGPTLFEENPDQTVHPASLTKMMTLYLLFDALRSGKLKMNSSIRFSAFAARQPPSKLGVRAGRSISVETAIFALAVKSGNDVAVAVAERLGGSEKQFATIMNAKARALGMARTNFVNASGLHDRAQVSTPRDLARLARGVLYNHENYFKYFSAKSFRYGARTYPTHNRFVMKYKGADGLKTGYVDASGFNLAGSAVRNGRRLVGVIVGGESAARRDLDLMGLMDSGFRVADGAPQPLFAGVAPVAIDWRTGHPALPPRRDGATATISDAAPIIATPAHLVASAPRRREPPLGPGDAANKSGGDIGDDDTGAYAAQVGAVANKRAASALAAKRLAALGKMVSGGAAVVAELRLKNGRRLYRARIGGLTGGQARDACETLHRAGRDCLVVAAPG